MLVPTPLNANDLNPSSRTADEVVKDLEGNTYQTVKIGKQVWLAENLRSTKFQDGSKINSAFIPDDKEENLLKYGRLYDWHDVSDERNICPEGWRVATDEDWKELERSIGMSEEELHQKGWRGGDQDLGVQLKEAQSNGLFKKFDPSQINKHNFYARPAGVKWNGFYITQGAYTEFWTSSSATDKSAIIRTLAYSWWNAHKGEIRRATSSKDYMFSVRCVKI
ncbi:fibrobacter succinogenes major paralogous domain-containing protein [Vibrio hannami]|uniref:fibrobacter succinogenes major paralogous domain-containing protein n=1 Tax=Vibrio hannami TaxID=2717094 RepID=UPI0024104ED4|nr:fibrobacter succinogenes major paralogous domain-containing protein [Vibrio hannami]MDG3086317.1 fibrobacter succinogenes major paralogous domain-containing protein [Vibrio hannami]